jgi:hypothetical protein
MRWNIRFAAVDCDMPVPEEIAPKFDPATIVEFYSR